MNDYVEHEKFVEVKFDLPNRVQDKNKFIEYLLQHYPDATNITVIPGEIRLEPRRLVKSLHDSSYTKYNTKNHGMIKDCRHDPAYSGVLECNDCRRHDNVKQ